jgi:transcriptional regulator with XRE-family HTH domain
VSYRRSRPVLIIDRTEALGPSLKDLRKSQGVSIYDMADAMESTHGTSITAWENNRVKPGTQKLIEALGTHDYVIVLMHKDEAARMLEERIRQREGAD